MKFWLLRTKLQRLLIAILTKILSRNIPLREGKSSLLQEVVGGENSRFSTEVCRLARTAQKWVKDAKTLGEITQYAELHPKKYFAQKISARTPI